MRGRTSSASRGRRSLLAACTVTALLAGITGGVTPAALEHRVDMGDWLREKARASVLHREPLYRVC
ncbi:MAG: hypothetical protein QOG53_3118 [Frankiales bacterium]|jgi:hypothetical protein|nr:hypothetical protein [Frankiales bacterium]